MNNDNNVDIDCCATKDDSLESERRVAVGLDSVAVGAGTDFQLVVLERDHAVADGLGCVVGHLDRDSARLAHSHVPEVNLCERKAPFLVGLGETVDSER